MLDPTGTVRQQTAQLVVGGFVVASNCIGLDARARQMMFGRILFDDMIVGAAPGFYGPVVKTADYTVVAADSGYQFTTRGASGAVIFTLPTTIPAGFRARFYSEANQNMAIACASKLVVTNNLTASSVTFSTSSQKIGASVEVVANDDQTKYLVNLLTSCAATVA